MKSQEVSNQCMHAFRSNPYFRKGGKGGLTDPPFPVGNRARFSSILPSSVKPQLAAPAGQLQPSWLS